MALGATLPQYAHVPMILRDDGQKMSKRTDAVSVMQYEEMGILPEALLNYLARLCWGHGDEEVFNMAKFIGWFDLDNISSSPARFDMKKLLWVNSEHIKTMDSAKLATLIMPRLMDMDIDSRLFNIIDILELVKTRSDNLNGIVAECTYFYKKLNISDEDAAKHLNEDALRILSLFSIEISSIEEWTLSSIKDMVKKFCVKENVKMPQLGMPLRLKLCGTTQTPAFDSVIFVLGKDEVLQRLSAVQ